MERRQFLQFVGGSFAASLAAYPFALSASIKSTDPLSFSGEEWQAMEAICDQILPPVSGISTRQVNCVNFIDKLLAHEERKLRGFYRDGLAALNAAAGSDVPAAYTGLSSQRQTRLLEQLEDGRITGWQAPATPQAPFFQTLYFHTLLGFLAAPSFGGNRGEQGWKAVGFPGHLHESGGISDQQVEGSNRRIQAIVVSE